MAAAVATPAAAQGPSCCTVLWYPEGGDGEEVAVPGCCCYPRLHEELLPVMPHLLPLQNVVIPTAANL